MLFSSRPASDLLRSFGVARRARLHKIRPN
jgi:hypothetical protein